MVPIPIASIEKEKAEWNKIYKELSDAVDAYLKECRTHFEERFKPDFAYSPCEYKQILMDAKEKFSKEKIPAAVLKELSEEEIEYYLNKMSFSYQIDQVAKEIVDTGHPYGGNLYTRQAAEFRKEQERKLKESRRFA